METRLPLAADVAESESQTAWADWAGMLASVGCAIHCAAMPLVIGYLPMLGISWLADESFHQVMTIVCFSFAVLAFVPGWKKHGSIVPASVGAIGVGLLALAAFGLECTCCPSSESSIEASASSQVQANRASFEQAEAPASACTDENCQVCAHANEAVKGDPAENVAGDGDFSWMIPFVSPLGGVFLVAGHLVNHRKACHCQGDDCCLS
ncbi:MAG: MerC domain-containing protein [Planctomycetota bacterium]